MSSIKVFQFCVITTLIFLSAIIAVNGQESTQSYIQYCLLNTGGIGICTNIHSCNLTILAQEGNPVSCDSDNKEDVFVCCPMQIPQPPPLLINTDINVNNANIKPNNISSITTSRSITTSSTITTKTIATSTITTTTTTTLPMIRTPEIRRMVQTAPLSKSAQKCMEYSKIKCSSTTFTSTIFNGLIVESVEQYPHMALIGYESSDEPGNLSWQCGGSLISEQYILTAAHCLKGINQTVPTTVHLGFLNRNNRNQFGTLQEFKIAEIIRHPDRVDPIAYHDIALLKLDRPAQLSKSVLPACLHEEKNISLAHAQATGWGDLFSGSNLGSDDLMKVSLALSKHSDCWSLYERHINRRLRDGIREEQQLCAGGDSKDACQGDSGGPLQIIGKDNCMHSIIGVTSFGDGCGVQPGVYTRVSHYVPWIESVVWP